MLRAFSAVEITDEEVLDELERVQDTLDLEFRPVDRERIHVTLQFFESVDDEELAEIKKGMQNLEIEPFKAEVNGIGAFPSRDFIRVVWAGFKNEEKFRKLKNQVSGHSVKEDNGNEFKPHLTLLRVSDVGGEKKRKLQRTIREFSKHEFGEIEVGKVKLFESRRTPHGTRYRELHSVEL